MRCKLLAASRTALALLLTGAAPFAAADVLITNPQPWQLRTEETVTFEGTYTPALGGPWRGELHISDSNGDREPYIFQAAGGRWRVPDVRLSDGVNRASAIIAGLGEHVLLLVKPSPAAETQPLGRQVVVLRWMSGVDTVLADIARRTIAGAREEEIGAFPKAVRESTLKLVQASLAQFDFDVTEGDPSGTGHTVFMSPRFVEGRFGGARFGETEPDCGNRRKLDLSTAYVGTLAREFMADGTWLPADKGDKFDRRRDDVANALTRVALHELLHGLGLVACTWMGPPDRWDSGGHSNPMPRVDEGSTRRFGAGANLMDSGRFVTGFLRIGEESQIRGSRVAPRLTAFDRAYLRALHPKTPEPPR